MSFSALRRLVTPRIITRSRPFSSAVWRVDNPYDGTTYCEVPTINAAQANAAINKAQQAYLSWRNTDLEQRIAVVNEFIKHAEKHSDQWARDVTGQMGKPLGQAKGEVATMVSRAKAMVEMSRTALKEENLPSTPGLVKRITKEAIGVVLVLSPWNYPEICAVNNVIAAVLSGCSVLLKHSDRTPLCANHFADAFKAAGAPAGLVQTFHADHALVAESIAHPHIAHVAFTGSVAGGRAVYQAIAKSRFIDCGLELGGKDPAYVTDEVNLAHAAANVLDGGMYNAGQSCCAVERVYVHERVYDSFIDQIVKEAGQYKLGNPMDASTNMGPIAQPNHPKFLDGQIKQALALGAKLLTGGSITTDANGKGRFFQPTLLTNCNHTMSVMTEESFGPVLAIQKVKSDDEAIKLMNDSAYGLTASVWTSNAARAETLGRQLDAGTVFQNRCDFFDPYLPSSGRKDSGRGYGLSTYGFLPYIKTKAYNYRLVTN